MLSSVKNDLAKAKRRWTEKKNISKLPLKKEANCDITLENCTQRSMPSDSSHMCFSKHPPSNHERVEFMITTLSLQPK